jgi:PhoPQ-activated pathogenicity-related protein
MQKNLIHHYQSMGGWTFEFSDLFYNNNITSLIYDQSFKSLTDIIDPYG